MNFFDLVYLKLVNTYGKEHKESGVSAATGILGGLYSANAMTLAFAIHYLFTSSKYFELWWVLLFFVLGQVFTHVWYILRKDKAIEKIEAARDRLSKQEYIRLNIWATLYIFLSVVFLIGSAGLFHYLNNR